MGIVENGLDEEVKVNHDDKIVHLQLIQGVIDRMATSAAIYKGFVATIVTGIDAISFTDVRSRVLLVAFLPVICFLAMDTYYLQLEKKYRILYEKVRTETIIPDFALNPYCTDDELKKIMQQCGIACVHLVFEGFMARLSFLRMWFLF